MFAVGGALPFQSGWSIVARMSSVLSRKLSLIVFTGFSLLAGVLALALILVEDPRNFAARDYALSRSLFHQAQILPKGDASRRAQLLGQARTALFTSLQYDPYNPALWTALWEQEQAKGGLSAPEARLIIMRLAPETLLSGQGSAVTP